MPQVPQFSLRTLIVIMLIAPIACWLFVSVPHLANLLLWTGLLLTTSALLATIVYGEGNVRAFALGCAPPITFCLLNLGNLVRTGSLFLIGMTFVTLMSGYLSVRIRQRLRPAEWETVNRENTPASAGVSRMPADRKTAGHARSVQPKPLSTPASKR